MSGEMSNAEAISKIWNIIRDVKIAMLTTVTPEGQLHSRPMATQESQFTGDLWFLTRQSSGKVDEIREGSNASLTYVNDDAHAFVALSGKASLSKDREKIHELWRPMHAIWFPKGKDDPEITVIRIAVDSAEYWESPGNELVRSYHLLKAVLQSDPSQAGEHGKAKLS